MPHWSWERRQLVPHVRFQLPFLGPENRNQASHVRASSVPTLYAPLAVDFAILGLIFGTARRSQKWDRESAFPLFFH